MSKHSGEGDPDLLGGCLTAGLAWVAGIAALVVTYLTAR